MEEMGGDGDVNFHFSYSFLYKGEKIFALWMMLSMSRTEAGTSALPVVAPHCWPSNHISSRLSPQNLVNSSLIIRPSPFIPPEDARNGSSYGRSSHLNLAILARTLGTRMASICRVAASINSNSLSSKYAVAARPRLTSISRPIRHLPTCRQLPTTHTQAIASDITTSFVNEEAILCAKIAAHSASISSAAVLFTPGANPKKRIVTTSLDKTVALFESEGDCEFICNSDFLEAQRITPPGGPVFSVLVDSRSDDGLPDQVYMGNHGKQVVAWVPPSAHTESGVVLDGHCGWVRALARAGSRWLFTAACKDIRQFDLARAVPSAVSTTVVEKGDILAMVASKATLYTAGSDGSIRSFSITDPNKGSKGGLTPAAVRPKAHNDRVTSLVLDGGILFSASYDGSVKAWDASTLEIVTAVDGAHGGERVNALTALDGVLYSGGGDCMVRRWSGRLMLLQEVAAPLHAHSHSVGVVAVGASSTGPGEEGGRKRVLVSGDTHGELAVWQI